MFLSSAMYAAPAKKKRKSGPDPFRQGSYHSAPSGLAYDALRVETAANTLLAHAEHYDPYTTAEQMMWLTGIRDAAREEYAAWSARSSEIVQRVKPPGAMGRRETAERAEGRMLAREASLRSEASMARGDRRHEGSVAAADAARAHRRGSRHAAKDALGALYRNNPEPFMRFQNKDIAVGVFAKYVRPEPFMRFYNDKDSDVEFTVALQEESGEYFPLLRTQSYADAIDYAKKYVKVNKGRR